MGVQERWEYREVYLKSVRWIAIRYACMSRDKYRCVACGRNRNLEVHHMTYQNRGKDMTSEAADCLTLCCVCHGKMHNGELDDAIVEKLARILRRNQEEDRKRWGGGLRILVGNS